MGGADRPVRPSHWPAGVTGSSVQPARTRGTSRRQLADPRRAELNAAARREKRLRMRAAAYAARPFPPSAKGSCCLGNDWGKPLPPPGLKPLLFFFTAYSSCDPGSSAKFFFSMTRFPDVKRQSLTLQLHFISPKIPSSHPIEQATKKSLLPQSRTVL